jgi:hypothetical protein
LFYQKQLHEGEVMSAHPMVLERTAMNTRFVIDPSSSYLQGKPELYQDDHRLTEREIITL